MSASALSIGDLARATGTRVEIVRHQRRSGLLAAPPRMAGNHRAYGFPDLARLGFVRRAGNSGLSIEQVRARLGLSERRDGPCETADATARGHLAEAGRRLADPAAHIDGCGPGTVAECRILDVPAPSGDPAAAR